MLLGFQKHQLQIIRNTETVLVKVVNNPLLVTDQGCVSLLLLLFLSVAFYTIDQTIFLDRLNMWGPSPASGLI